MEVKLLSITHYDENGRHLHTEDIPQPIWAQMEESIRRLDQFQRPAVHLHLYADVIDDDFLAVFGGNGVYALSAALNDSYPNYHDASKSDEEIAVWTSDQGYYPEEKYVCCDLELVLKIAYYYAQFGKLSPAAVWL